LPAIELGLLEAMDHFSAVDNDISGPLPDSLKEWKDIRILAIEGNKISGPLPGYLSSFKKLEFAHLAHNALTGSIPPLTNLTSLRDFVANDNQLTGSMATFFQMKSLETLNLRNNQLTGKLTDDVFLNTPGLVLLDLGGNLLTGSIPSQFYDIATVSLRQNQLTGPLPVIDRDDYAIEFLNLHGNALSGELPQNLGDLSQLQHLDVSMNAFTGRIPSESLNTLSNLIYLYLGDNQYNEHHFPVLFALEYLQELSLRNANLIGAIPTWVGTSMMSLQFLDASHNHLNDTIPYEMGDLETIRFLMLDHNQLSGMVPTSFPQLQHLHVLTLSQNALIGGMKPICEDGDGPEYLDLLVVDCEVHSSCNCCSYCCAAGSEATCLTANFSPNVNNTYERDVYVFPSEGLSYNPHQLQQHADDAGVGKASN
jgi:Leucine-rich repeat (LRR) protein